MQDIDTAIEILERQLALAQTQLDHLRATRAILTRLVPGAAGPESAPEQAPVPEPPPENGRRSPAADHPWRQDERRGAAAARARKAREAGQLSDENGEAPKRRSRGGRETLGGRREGVHPREKGLLNRLAIARFLAATGGATFGQIKNGTPVPNGSITAVLKQPWFKKAGHGLYELTSEGRRQLAAHGARQASATPEGQESNRLRIARLIRTEGPMSVGTLVGKAGLPLSVVHPAVRHEWFTVNGGKYSLTAEGESALRTSTPSDEE